MLHAMRARSIVYQVLRSKMSGGVARSDVHSVSEEQASGRSCKGNCGTHLGDLPSVPTSHLQGMRPAVHGIEVRNSEGPSRPNWLRLVLWQVRMSSNDAQAVLVKEMLACCRWRRMDSAVACGAADELAELDLTLTVPYRD